MSEMADRDVRVEQQLRDLAADRVRLNLLVLLNECTAGAGEIAEKLGIEKGVAAEILEEMLAGDLIEVVEEAPRRGEAVPRYRALVRAGWNDEEWARFGFEERWRLSAWVVQLINSDLAEAMSSGTFAARTDAHTSRAVLLVDEEGWRDLNRIKNEALEACFTIQAESAERLAESGAEGISAISAMLCCELPPRR